MGVFRSAMAANAGFGSVSFFERVRTEPRHQPLPLFLIVDGAIRRSAKLQPVRLFPASGPDTQPQRALWLGQRSCALGEIAKAAKMHMEVQVAAKVVAEMLAVRDDAAEFSAIEEGRVWKLTRGRVRVHSAIGKDRCLPIAKAMDLISLGHSFSSPRWLQLQILRFAQDDNGSKPMVSSTPVWLRPAPCARRCPARRGASGRRTSPLPIWY